MVRIFCLIGLALLSLASVSHSSAATPPTDLSVKDVKVLDSTTVRVTFSDSIDLTSMVLKISKQSDNASVTMSDMTWVLDTPESVDIMLSDDLEEGSSYTLTVQAAISLAGATIIDGAGALREFVTPSPLKKSNPKLNAPANAWAVMASSGKTVVSTPEKTPVILPPPMKKEPVPTEELPLTGMNPLFFLVLALPLAYIALRRQA